MFSCDISAKRYTEYFLNAAEEFDIDLSILLAVARTESGFNPHAKSPAGAIGIMQIMSETGRWIAECLSVCDYSEEDLFDPALNIRFGAFYLSRLLLSFDARWLSLAAYNAGEGKVRDWIDGGIDSLESIPYKETRIYVRRVERAINYYKDKKFVCFN